MHTASNIYLHTAFINPYSCLGFGVITSDSVEDAFRGVDRKFFVPRVRETAYMFTQSKLACILLLT